MVSSGRPGDAKDNESATAMIDATKPIDGDSPEANPEAPSAANKEHGRGKSRENKRSHESKRIVFRIFPEEGKKLRERAAEAAMSVSEFCRRASSGKRITSRYDYEVIHRLAALHGDQARLGNLFKISLDKDHLAYNESDKRHIMLLLKNLEQNQEDIKQMLQGMKKT